MRLFRAVSFELFLLWNIIESTADIAELLAIIWCFLREFQQHQSRMPQSEMKAMLDT